MKIQEKSNFIPFWVFALLFITFSAYMFPQDYKYEIGGAAGTSFYMGDANRSKLYFNPGIASGILFRYNINFYCAIKANLIAGTVSGNSEDSGNRFPFDQKASFHRTFAEIGAQVEFNFFPYSDKFAYRGTKRYTPYLFAGTGVTYATGKSEFLNANLPFGAGFKCKLKNRLHIGFEFSFRKLFGDDFDVTGTDEEWSLKNPYGIESCILKNRDWYSLTMIYLTWEFGMRYDPCHGN